MLWSFGNTPQARSFKYQQSYQWRCKLLSVASVSGQKSDIGWNLLSTPKQLENSNALPRTCPPCVASPTLAFSLFRWLATSRRLRESPTDTSRTESAVALESPPCYRCRKNRNSLRPQTASALSCRTVCRRPSARIPEQVRIVSELLQGRRVGPGKIEYPGVSILGQVIRNCLLLYFSNKMTWKVQVRTMFLWLKGNERSQLHIVQNNCIFQDPWLLRGALWPFRSFCEYSQPPATNQSFEGAAVQIKYWKHILNATQNSKGLDSNHYNWR